MTTETVQRDRTVSDIIADLRSRLRKQAYLYDSPHDFRAGVDAALNAVQRQVIDFELEEMFSQLDAD